MKCLFLFLMCVSECSTHFLRSFTTKKNSHFSHFFKGLFVVQHSRGSITPRSVSACVPEAFDTINFALFYLEKKMRKIPAKRYTHPFFFFLEFFFLFSEFFQKKSGDFRSFLFTKKMEDFFFNKVAKREELIRTTFSWIV